MIGVSSKVDNATVSGTGTYLGAFGSCIQTYTVSVADAGAWRVFQSVLIDTQGRRPSLNDVVRSCSRRPSGGRCNGKLLSQMYLRNMVIKITNTKASSPCQFNSYVNVG